MQTDSRMSLLSAAVLAAGLNSTGCTPTQPGASSDLGGSPTPGSDAGDLASSSSDLATNGSTLRSCPTKGGGALFAPGSQCYLLTPAEAGASATGENATVSSYVLTPSTTVAARGQLVVHMNGSGGTPGGNIADPQQNFYAAAASLGYAVIALSYSSQKSLKTLCTTSDACYFPSRQALILGAAQPGAAPELAAITTDQGIAGRLLLTLQVLAARDPAHGWGDFIVTAAAGAPPSAQLAWSKFVISGHSQGGGHAAALGKLFPVARVIQLSATCDEASGTPATWLTGTAGSWASDPTHFYGLGSRTVFTSGKPTGGDTTCFTHAASWQSLGMLAANRNDNASTCAATGDTHGVTIGCKDNYNLWLGMLQ